MAVEDSEPITDPEECKRLNKEIEDSLIEELKQAVAEGGVPWEEAALSGISPGAGPRWPRKAGERGVP